MEILGYLLIGVLGGIFGGMGMGGGTALIPLLVLVLGVSQKVAQAVNVISFIPMAVVTITMHKKNKLISAQNLLPLIISAILSSIGGCILANTIESRLLVKLFGGFLSLLSVYQIVCKVKKNSKFICATSTKERLEKTIKKMTKKSSNI